MNTGYKFRFYFNARHSVTFNQKKSNVHPHTWEVIVVFCSNTEEIVNFTEFERELENYFSFYEGKLINELDAFKDINPTMENIAGILYEDIKSLVNRIKLNLKRIEISENPARTFIIEE